MRRRVLALMLLGTLTLGTVAGCWDRKEIDALALVAAVGIDISETPGEVLVTAQLIRPGQMAGSSEGGGAQQGSPFWVVRTSAETIFKAVRELTTMSSRRLYFPHNQVIVFGEEAAKQGIAPLLDFLTRDDELRPTVWVVVARGKASDFLEGVSGFAAVPGLALSQLIQTRFASSEIAGLQIDHLHARIMSKTFAPIATLASLTEPDQSQQQDESPQSSALDPQSPMERVLRLDGTAVFRGDKLVGYLDLVATRGYLWLRDEVQTGILVVNGPGKSGKVSLEILTARAQLKPEIKDGKVMMRAQIKATCNLAEQFGQGKLATPELFADLEQRAADAIKHEMALALDEAKRLGADIFGFGEEVHKAHPRQWSELEQQWDRVFPTLDVDISAEVRLRRFGQIVEMPHSEP